MTHIATEASAERGSVERQSNLELLRIIGMLLVIAHHFVVNSGISDRFDPCNPTLNMVFLQLWGMWGKTAINIYVLISGYFMCTRKLTWQRFLKLFVKIEFYLIALDLIFVIAGYDSYSVSNLFYVLTGGIAFVNDGFTIAFLAMYLFIPFMNAAIAGFRENIWKLAAALLCLFTVSATFFNAYTVFHHVFWYMTLYFVAACIRLYPNRWTESKKFAGILLAVSIVASWCSVLVLDGILYLTQRNDWWLSYFMVADSNKLLAFLVALSAFLFFKNLRIRYSPAINLTASTAFGVLLIHAHSDAMRRWLWVDLLNVPGMHDWSLFHLAFAALFSMLGVYAVCAAIDYCYIQFIEKPLFRWLSMRSEKIEGYARNLRVTIKKLCARLCKALEPLL